MTIIRNGEEFNIGTTLLRFSSIFPLLSTIRQSIFVKYKNKDEYTYYSDTKA